MEQAVTVLLLYCTIHYIFYYLLKKFFDVFACSTPTQLEHLAYYTNTWNLFLRNPMSNKIFKKEWKINKEHYKEDEVWNVIYILTPLFGKWKGQKTRIKLKKPEKTGDLWYSWPCQVLYVCKVFFIKSR